VERASAAITAPVPVADRHREERAFRETVQALFSKERGNAQPVVADHPGLDGVVHNGRGVDVVDGAHAQAAPGFRGFFRIEAVRLHAVDGGLRVVSGQRRNAAIHIELARLFFNGHATHQIANPLFHRHGGLLVGSIGGNGGQGLLRTSRQQPAGAADCDSKGDKAPKVFHRKSHANPFHLFNCLTKNSAIAWLASIASGSNGSYQNAWGNPSYTISRASTPAFK
jgi:hypothetical protein